MIGLPFVITVQENVTHITESCAFSVFCIVGLPLIITVRRNVAHAHISYVCFLCLFACVCFPCFVTSLSYVLFPCL